METVGVRELKNHLSHYLKRVEQGAIVTITDHHRPIARIIPVEPSLPDGLPAMVEWGEATWGGGKPRGVPRPIKVATTKSIAERVSEDRR